MLIALLVVLGVDLIVVVAFAAFVLGRRRWLKRQPGEFAGRIRVSSGDVDGLSPKWKRGSGRWVRDVFVWTKAPLLVRNELMIRDLFYAPGRYLRAGDVSLAPRRRRSRNHPFRVIRGSVMARQDEGIRNTGNHGKDPDGDNRV